MTDIQKTIDIIFNGVDNLSGVSGSINSQLSALTGTVEGVAAPLAVAADNVLKLDAALLALTAAGLLYAFNASKNFENATIEMKKVLGETGDIDVATDAAVRLSEIYGESASEILLSAANYKQAGYDINESLVLTKAGLDLVIAGNIGAEASSKLIIRALKGFGEGADEATRYVDILNEVSNTYATDVEQLAIGMSRIAPIAQIMGFSMEEAAGLLTPIIEIFGTGSEAANALRTGLLKLIDDTTPVAEGLASIGVAQHDANRVLRSGKDIYYDVAVAFQTLNDDQKLFVTQQLVGIEQSAKMVKVFDNLALSSEITGTAMGAAGSAAKEVAERLKSAEVSVNLFKVSFDNMAVALGDEFRLAAQEAIDGGTDIVQAIRDMIKDGTFAPLLDKVAEFSSDFGKALTQIAKDLPAAFEDVRFDDLMDTIDELSRALGLVFEDIDLSTPEVITKAVQKVIDSFDSLLDITIGMVEGFKPFIDSMFGFVQSFNEMDDAAKRDAGGILALASAVTKAGALVAAVILIIGDNADELSAVFTIVVNTISAAFDATKVTWGLLKLAFLDIVEAILGSARLLANIPGFRGFRDDIDENIAAIHKWRVDTEADTLAAGDAFMLHATGITTNFSAIGEAARNSTIPFKGYRTALDEINAYEKINTEITSNAPEAAANVGELRIALDEINAYEKINTEIVVDADTKEVTRIKKEFEWFDEEGKRHVVMIDATSTNIDKVKADIETIPTEKILAIKLQGEIDVTLQNIISQAEIVQTALEWEAKVEIAEVEAAGKAIEAAFESAGDSVIATASAASSMFGDLAAVMGDLSTMDKWFFQDILKEQIELERQAVEAQARLIDAQIRLINQQEKAIADGDALIKIDSTGLEPALEMIFWQVFEKVQVEVAKQKLDVLLGL